MKRRIAYILTSYFAWVAVFMLLKALFMIVEPAYSPLSLSDICSVVCHGFAMDLSVAGYLSFIPLVTVMVSVWLRHKCLDRILSVYFIVVAVVVSLIFVCDAALYPFWGFRIDMTPLFYFTTSPSSAMASVEWWMWIAGFLVTGVLALGIIVLQWQIRKRMKPFGYGCGRKWLSAAVLLVVGGVMFVAVRGGFTVSTMNPSRSYFSDDMKLNHAALNPVFTLLYSATHQDDFGDEFRFMDDAEAERAMSELYVYSPGDSLPVLSSTPDVYIIILESFSAHLMPSLGGEAIATNLDAIATEGLLFTNAYASGFRTDRALPAILSGYPAQPTASLMKYVNKLDGLPSIMKSLGDAGYDVSYYYGGDINFTNLNAYLVSAGVDEIVCDADFPVSERMSKWGVHDEKLFDRAVSDIKKEKDGRKHLRIIQTSSSHEPFDVPYNVDPNKRVNAFRYTDRCLGNFIDEMKVSGAWDKALVIITPDHYGCYPEGLEDPLARHHIPIVFTGGVMSGIDIDESLLERPASQTDIAATLLSLLDIDASDFRFSSNMFDPNRPAFAFFSEPGWAVMLKDSFATIISTEDGRILPFGDMGANSANEHYVKAYLQSLYSDLSRR